MLDNFLGETFFQLPETKSISQLFERAKTGLAFYGATKQMAGEKLKQLQLQENFEQLITLLQVFRLLAASSEFISLEQRPIAGSSVLKEQQRLQKIYHFIDTHYHEPIDVNVVAAFSNLTTAAFCRYFKKSTHLTFTDFLNQYRVNQAKKMLMQDHTVTEACYASGFENLSYFNKVFRRFSGTNPSAFKKMSAA
jgi:AraC-like DNA-binding protein